MTKAFPSSVNDQTKGMDLRDWFAGKFLTGAAATSEPLELGDNASQRDIEKALRQHWDNVAQAAYIAADAMIAARKGSVK